MIMPSLSYSGCLLGQSTYKDKKRGGGGLKIKEEERKKKAEKESREKGKNKREDVSYPGLHYRSCTQVCAVAVVYTLDHTP